MKPLETLKLPNNPHDASRLLSHVADLVFGEESYGVQWRVEEQMHGEGWRIIAMCMPNFAQAFEMNDGRRRFSTVVMPSFYLRREHGMHELLIDGMKHCMTTLFTESEVAEVKPKKDGKSSRVVVKRVLECGNCAAFVKPGSRQCDHCQAWFA